MVLAAFGHLRRLEGEGYGFLTYSNFPEFEEDAGGPFRRVTQTSTGPPRYQGSFALERQYKAPVAYDELDGFGDLVAYVRTLPAVVDFLFPPRFGAVDERFLTVQVASLPLAIVDRHIHLCGWDLDEGLLLSLYVQMEIWWLYHDRLPADLVVPILAVSFTADRLELGEGRYIERLDDLTQLARWPSTSRAQEHAPALRACTHALVIPGITLTSDEALSPWLSPVDNVYPVLDVERLFQALAVTADTHSGYAQFVFRPQGWANGFQAHLPVVTPGPLVNRYAQGLTTGLSEPSQTLDAKQETLLVQRYSALGSASQATQLACTRLLGATRREDQHDRIVDLCIAMEALVGDNSPGDTTYKLRLRTAALLSHELAAEVVFDWMNTVYGFRSAVVHGTGRAEKKSLMKLGDQTVSSDGIAEFFLRLMLARVLEKPELTASALDEVILKSLNTAASQDRSASDAEVRVDELGT